MRVLQLIDSLHAGGAERVAVNLANGLVSKVEKSYLCTTREEGLLKSSVLDSVGYLFLNKKSTIDTKAIKRLSAFVKSENIHLIHAHSSSYFLASIIKFLNKKIKIIWHDHYGNRAASSNVNNLILKQCSKQFNHIFCVNGNLVAWAKSYLNFKDVSYLPNFVAKSNIESKTKLFGEKGKRIVCLANLRPDKDHFNLLDAFKLVNSNYPEWTLHCIGKHFDDEYNESIMNHVEALKLEKQVFFYNSIPDVVNVLNQSTIGVLSSKSEGLPMALLEYGMVGLPAVVTNVGECSQVVLNGEVGQMVPAKDINSLSKAIIKYIEDSNYRKETAILFKQHIEDNYSAKHTVDIVNKAYLKILNY